MLSAVVGGCLRLSAVVAGPSLHCDWSIHLFLDVQNSWQAQHFVNLNVQAQHFVNFHVQNSWQAQHFVNLHAPLEALAVALSAVVCGCLRWSPVRPSIVIGVFLFLDVQNSWQAQHFVNLHVQKSWQAQHFVNLHVQISWQAQHFVNLHV